MVTPAIVIETRRQTDEISTTTSAHPIFSGKGGVGKTSIACATADQLAEANKRRLPPCVRLRIPIIEKLISYEY